MASLPPEFKRRLEAQERDFEKIGFSVLVWGPGPGQHDAYAKRVKVREHLESHVGPGQVFFSEDQIFQESVEKYGAFVAEAMQCKTVDAVIVLDFSPGPHTEVSLFGNILREKGIVFVHEHHLHGLGFARMSWNCLKVHPINAEEFEHCQEMRRLSLEFVQGLRWRKFEKIKGLSK